MSLDALPNPPGFPADEPPEAWVREVAGGYHDPFGFQHVQHLMSRPAGNVRLYVKYGAPVGVMGLGQVVGDVAQDISSLAAGGDVDGDVARCVAGRRDRGQLAGDLITVVHQVDQVQTPTAKMMK